MGRDNVDCRSEAGREDDAHEAAADGNEVDFIIEEKMAFEVKYNANAISESRYEAWKKAYPDIPLRYVAYIKKEGGRALWPWEV